MPVQPGDDIGPYRIEGPLGSGGMATVYKAYHEKLDRHVAIKMMHQALMSDDSFQQRFEREARIIAQLDHPHIVPIYDFSEHEGAPYLVMKYIEGRTLKRVQKESAVPVGEIMRIMRPIADALDFAHEFSVLHRDIKPSNILIDPQARPYLTDFGLARLSHSGESTMSADMLLGTPHYISPEQAQGSRDIDKRTDVYALGVVLYELLTGRVPFSADTPYATVHDHIYTPPPPPSQLNPELSPAVEGVLLTALAKDPDARYDSAGALLDALEVALAGSELSKLDAGRSVVDYRHLPTPTPVPRKSRNDDADAPRNPFEALGQSIGRAVDDAFDTEDMKLNLNWRPGTEWHTIEGVGAGFYTDEEVEAIEAARYASLSDEERVRRKVEKRIKKAAEERNGLIGHAAAYVMVNVMLMFIWFSSGWGFFWPMFVIGGWGIGMVAHLVSYYNEYGPGRHHREARVEAELQREIQRELQRTAALKRKNDENSSAANRRAAGTSLDDLGPSVRLSGDGELTDSFVEDWQDAEARRRRDQG